MRGALGTHGSIQSQLGLDLLRNLIGKVVFERRFWGPSGFLGGGSLSALAYTPLEVVPQRVGLLLLLLLAACALGALRSLGGSFVGVFWRPQLLSVGLQI